MDRRSRVRRSRPVLALAALAGLLAAPLLRALALRAISAKLRSDLERLNAGDYRPLLAGYADDAVLHFNEGAHRFAGRHEGRAAIERFLEEFTAAGLRGSLEQLWIAGPPWALTLLARFDDEAVGPDGERLYANRTVLVARTRWGRIVEQHDFFEDTRRIEAFEERLRTLGREPASAGRSR